MDCRIRIEEACICGNKDDAEYRLYETDRGTEMFGKQCVSCTTEWLPKYYVQLTNSQPSSGEESEQYLYKRVPPASQVPVVRRKVDQFNKVVEGNHITWRNECGEWNHGIVAKVDDDLGLGVIHWMQKEEGDLEVVKRYLPSADDLSQVYFRIEYPEEIEKANDLNLILARAYSWTGDKKNGCLKNEALPFAAFCKTGCENQLYISCRDEINFAGDSCDCGNDDPVKFLQYRDADRESSLLGRRCNSCKVEWLVGKYIAESDHVAGAVADHLYRRDPPDLEENTALKIRDARTKIDRRVDTLKPGDHITWERSFGYWHHAIVVRVEQDQLNPSKTKIVVIQWHKSGKLLKDGWGAIEIGEESLPAEVDQDSLYRVDYPEDVVKANDTKLVLARARSRRGETGYGFLHNNCESFATFCKTGAEVCHQTAWLAQKGREILESTQVVAVKDFAQAILGGLSALAKEAALKEPTGEMIATFVRGATSKLAESLKSAVPQMTDKTAKEVAKRCAENTWKVTAAESLEKMKHASNWMGVGIVFALELVSVVKDVRKQYQAKKAGNLSRRDWIKEATQRASEGTTSAIFTCLGSLFGSFTPLGFVGSIIGGAIGSFLGKCLGNVYIGSPLGRLVSSQFDDNKVVREIGHLKSGDHISFKHESCPHKKCHAIITKREEGDVLRVIRDTHDPHRGVVEEQLNFGELHVADLRIENETDSCADPKKIVEYATVKKFEDYEDDVDSYRCKDFARECRIKAKVLLSCGIEVQILYDA